MKPLYVGAQNYLVQTTHSSYPEILRRYLIFHSAWTIITTGSAPGGQPSLHLGALPIQTLVGVYEGMVLFSRNSFDDFCLVICPRLCRASLPAPQPGFASQSIFSPQRLCGRPREPEPGPDFQRFLSSTLYSQAA
jgi:hypothetical protein